MEFYRWEGDPQEILKGVRENLNMLGEVLLKSSMHNWLALTFVVSLLDTHLLEFVCYCHCSTGLEM